MSNNEFALENIVSDEESNDVSIRSQVPPQKGKLVVFDARRFHASSSPINNDVRIIMNVVFKVNNDD